MSEAEALMRGLLLGGGFSFEGPDPRAGWEAFKSFVRTPLPGLMPYTAGYECFHVDDRDDVLWFSFIRRFDPDAGIPDCGCVFSRVAPRELWGVNASDWWWPEHGTLTDWLAQVEGQRVFAACVGLGGWRWEGFTG